MSTDHWARLTRPNLPWTSQTNLLRQLASHLSGECVSAAVLFALTLWCFRSYLPAEWPSRKGLCVETAESRPAVSRSVLWLYWMASCLNHRFTDSTPSQEKNGGLSGGTSQGRLEARMGSGGNWPGWDGERGEGAGTGLQGWEGAGVWPTVGIDSYT